MKLSDKLVDDILRRKDVFLAALKRAMPQVTVTTTEPEDPLNAVPPP